MTIFSLRGVFFCLLVGGALFIGWGVTGVTVHTVAIFVVLVLGVGGLMGWGRGDCEKML